jgi:hypothetical protein
MVSRHRIAVGKRSKSVVPLYVYPTPYAMTVYNTIGILYDLEEVKGEEGWVR